MCWGTYSAHGGSNLAKFFPVGNYAKHMVGREVVYATTPALERQCIPVKFPMCRYSSLTYLCSDTLFIYADNAAIHVNLYIQIFCQCICLYFVFK